MVDQSWTAFPECTCPVGTDLVAITDDPCGTPISKKVTINNLLALGGGNTFARVVKKADETVNNSTTLQDDDELLFTAKANKTYAVMLVILQNSGVTPDFKFGITVPTSATAVGIVAGATWARGTTPNGFTQNFENVQAIFTAGTDQINYFFFIVKVLGNSGDVTLQWAQNIATVEDTKVLEGATLRVYEET